MGQTTKQFMVGFLAVIALVLMGCEESAETNGDIVDNAWEASETVAYAISSILARKSFSL